ncbi:F420-dependent NADP oxidoreductase [Rhodobacteraceae bacterium CCMM004]|nr:F420-dependent NADP oxidoreductase [Rhodobacteraceae bacterium CCMM004]
MRIGIIGKGTVAQALAASLGTTHDIRFGVRQPRSQDHGTLPDVAAWADAVILATPWRAEADVATEIAAHVRGKPVLDATNPVVGAQHGPDVAAIDGAGSAAERLQSRLPGAHVVKTFNQTGAEFLKDPGALRAKPAMFAAGDDEASRRIALALIADAGFEPVDCGPLANARHLESLAMIWIWQAIKGPLKRRFGFALSHLPTKLPQKDTDQ